jgi:thiol-disulfide isomerase/thioredoxin
MLYKGILYFLIPALFISLYSQAQSAKIVFDPLKMIDLNEKDGITIFKNTTGDTLKLSGTFFNWLPYRESSFKLKIAPGMADSLKFQFSYPDFIFINNSFAVYNGPGGRVICTIKSIKVKTVDITFKGSYEQQNAYYVAYHNYIGNPDQEGRPYYNAGDKLIDFNKFPAIADSITQIRLSFLANYPGQLPGWFKKHEYWRLKANGTMRKYNVLASKQFYGGKPIPVNKAYYDFEQQFKLVNNEMIVNTEYLWAADFYLLRQSKKISKKTSDGLLYVIDSLLKNTREADVLKMRGLGVIYTSSKAKYDSVYQAVVFNNNTVKERFNNLVQTQLGFPKLGVKVPAITLKDIDGKTVSLADYAGKTIIINFWAIWCGPCIAEFPNENKLVQQYKQKDLVVINICVDSDRERWQLISKRDKLQMINLFADNESYQGIKTKFNIGALPRSILINKDLKVADNYFKRASLITAKDLEMILK